MSKHVTFALSSSSSTDSLEDIVNITTPQKPSTLNENPGPLNILITSPGLSPIRNQHSRNSLEIDNSSDSDEFMIEDESHFPHETGPDTLNENTNVTIDEGNDESRLSYLSFIEDSSVNRSIVNSDTSLNSISFLQPQDDSNASFSFNAPPIYRTTVNNVKSNTMTPPMKSTLNSKGSSDQSPSINNSSPKGLFTSPATQYLRPGALFTVVIDDTGQPMLVPVLTGSSLMFQPSFQPPTSEKKVASQSPLKPNPNDIRKEPELEKYFTSPSKISISPNAKLDSRYFRERLQRRSITSVLGI